MKSKELKLFSIVLLLICCIFGTNIYAASVTLSGSQSGDPNSKVTVTVSGDFTGRVNLSASNGTLSSSSVWIESNSQAVTVTLGSSGTTTITATPAVGASDAAGNMITVPATSKSITVKQPVVNNNPPVTPPANNNNTSNNVTTNNNNASTSNTNKNTNTNTSKKSSNANLKNLLLDVEGMSPAFAKNITAYSLNVNENVNEIKVNASVEHSRASYSVTGNKDLKEGENIIEVKIIAEDGTVKTYTINVLKADDPVKSDATLSSIIIEDVDLGQTFDPNITEYDAGDIKVKANKLNIYAYTTSDNAKMEIIGNEDLTVGKQKITIRVTSENGKIVKDYVISFNKLYSENKVDIYGDELKRIEDKESIVDKITSYYNNNVKPNMTILVLYLFIWIEFAQVIYLYNRLKKYEDLDKITVGKRIKENKNKEKIQKTRRKKQNPVFPDEENN